VIGPAGHPNSFIALLASCQSRTYSDVMRVLIIGCGYVGLPLGAELAKQGHQVFAVRRSRGSEKDIQAVGIQPLICDITKPEDLAKLPLSYDWVVNCVASSGGSAEEYRRLYLEGSRNLLEWLSASPPQKFVYTSSTSVYGQTDGSVVTEASPTEPAAETAKILVQTENVLLNAAGTKCTVPLTPALSPSEGAREGKSFPAVILRVAGIYGPDRGYWFRQFLRGEATIENQGERILNMIHRDDVVGAIMAALKNGPPGEIYNAVDDEPVNQLPFFEWLSKKLGKPLPRFSSEEKNGARKRGLTNKKVLNARLRSELEYQFKYPTFREGYQAEILRLGL
jgi:nucleoside-diphosphate-sugar epimerase